MSVSNVRFAVYCLAGVILSCAICLDVTAFGSVVTGCGWL